MPEHPKAEGVPLIYSHTADAGPDQSFLLVGERFGGELTAWGPDPDRGGGREIKPKVHMAMGGWLLATLPESAYDGPIVVWAKNAAGWSDPIVLNAPQAWWCQPEVARPGDTLRVFGRDLSERPDFSRAFVCLTRSGQRIAWLKVVQAGKYQVRVELPKLLEPGAYELRVHAGAGGAFGWGEPLPLTVRGAGDPAPDAVVNLQSGDVQQAVDRIAAAGGGTVNLSEGVYQLNGTLVVPADVRVHGAGRDRTFLVSPSDPAYRLSSVASSAWSQGPTGVYTAGDRMVYKVEFPTAGSWTVWLRYATKMSPYKLPGVSRHMTLALDGGQPVWLDHLPNTGSFGMFKWSSSATIQATAGPHEMVWQNVKGGGIHIDVFVLAKDPSYTPSDNPLPTSDPSTIVIQGEDVIRFESKDGAAARRRPPGGRLAGRRSGGHLGSDGPWQPADEPRDRDLQPQASGLDRGVPSLRRSRQRPRRQVGRESRHPVVPRRRQVGRELRHPAVPRRRGHGDEQRAMGPAPLMLSGVRRSCLASNRLVSQTLRDGNAEAYILGRNETLRKCIVEDNVCACPPGAQGGGPTGRRILWFSTGRGSVDLNWIAGNREDRARFGGVAGTDQNVGEMISFEACERIAYYGPVVSAQDTSVTLPARLESTPDDRLGSVKREQLTHDAAGHETPFWPPEVDVGGH